MDVHAALGHGRIALLVGGTKGIGKATAAALAHRGFHVLVVGRTAPAGETLVAELRAAGHAADFIAADVSLMAEVRRLAVLVERSYPRLDLLIHSADILRLSRLETAEGIEASFAINYLSRFLLNQLLLALLRASAPARILHVAAAGMPGNLDLAHVPPRPRASSMTGHTVGQHANDVYGVEMAARLAGSGVTINIMNPGMVATGIRRTAADGRWLLGVADWLFKPWAVPADQFAEHVVRWATDPALVTVSGQLVGSKGQPIRIPTQRQDATVRDALWRKSAALAGVDVAPEVPHVA